MVAVVVRCNPIREGQRNMIQKPRMEGTGPEADRFAEIIGDRQHVGNQLLPELERLFEMHMRLEQRTARLAAEHEKLKVELVNMVRSLDLIGRVDGMTGLANRRDMMERIEREGSRSNRHQRIFSLILVNIDDFRRVNDFHGYNAGDDVLVEIARVLRGSVRSEDVCARWGGDEFLILLPETGRGGAQALARKVLASIFMTEFKAHKPGIHITASIGIREFDHSQSAYECVFKADQALQQAKREGKNRCVTAE